MVGVRKPELRSFCLIGIEANGTMTSGTFLTRNRAFLRRTLSFVLMVALSAVKLHFGTASSQAVNWPFVTTIVFRLTRSTRSAVKYKTVPSLVWLVKPVASSNDPNFVL